MHVSFLLALVLWAALSFLPTPAAAASADPARQPLPAELEQRLFDLTNIERAKYGLTPVELDLAVIDIARTRAGAQLGPGPLSHFDPSGQPAISQLLALAGVSYQLAGENLARSPFADATLAERIEQALMQSPTHRRNILEPTFTGLAIGTALDASGRIAVAEVFRAVWADR